MADIGGTRGMAFSGDGKSLAMSGITNVSNAFAGIGNPIVLLFNWEDGKEIVQYGSKANVNGVAWNCATGGRFWLRRKTPLWSLVSGGSKVGSRST